MPKNGHATQSYTGITIRPIHRIAMDTIGPLDIAKHFKYILVIIDTFTRYEKLFPTNDVSADAATDALWDHSCRFGTPQEIMMDYGTQFMNKTLEGFAALTAAYRIQRRKTA